jgi:hypothetical protein
MTTAEKASRHFAACFFPCLGDLKPEEPLLKFFNAHEIKDAPGGSRRRLEKLRSVP